MHVELKLDGTYTNRIGRLKQSLELRLVSTAMVIMDILPVFYWFAMSWSTGNVTATN